MKDKLNATELTFTNLSSVVCLPCREDTIRGYSRVRLLVIDEAARVPDDLYRTVRPMLAVSQGRMVCLSTPNGRRGFFWREWAQGGDDWHKIEIPATQVPRIAPEFLEAERRALGDSWFRQEYMCSFEALEGLVFPEFRKQVVVESLPQGYPDRTPKVIGRGYWRGGSWCDGERYEEQPQVGEWVGGIDFGFRNPFAAVCGILDKEDVLWLVGEHYAAQQPLPYHAGKLSKVVTWYADPAGASDICELRRAGFCVKKGLNSIRTGLSAVADRIRTGRLKILKGRCPNLLREAELYRYANASASLDADAAGDDDTPASENPIDAHNHALAALRYLIARIDQNKQIAEPKVDVGAPTPLPRKLDEDDERLWRAV